MESIVFVCISVVVGLFVGSFLNVLVLRLHTGLSPAKGRSMCFSCGKTLGVSELIPVLSYLLQRGKCRGCAARISPQYPIVESMTAVLFGLVAYVNTVPTNIFDVGRLILAFASMSMFVSIAVYDIKHKIIPNEFVVTLVGIGVAQALLHMWFGQMELMFLVSHIATAIILFLPFYILWVVSKGKWIGLGDGKLAFALGMILPLSSALSGITIAFWVGAVYGLTAIAMSKIGFKKYTLKTEVPFAPFLILGAVLVYFVPLDLFHVLLLQEYVWNLF